MHGVTCLKQRPCSSHPRAQVDLASMYIQSSVRGICNAPAVPSASCLAVQPGTGHLALTSASGSLQFFDALRQVGLWRDGTAVLCRVPYTTYCICLC